jgi:RNA recognition motif-containing protein
MGRFVYVTNISFQSTEDDLRRTFSVAGTVRTIKMLMDDKTGKFKGCCFVEMTNDREAREAVNSLHEALVMERLISVEVARPMAPKESRPSFHGNKPQGAAYSRKPRKS